VAFFQALGKTERDSGQSDTSSQVVRLPDHDSGYSDTSGSVTLNGADSQRMSKSSPKGTGAMVYGIVMYDFAAERPDELDAKAGEAIIVIAQSNPEWFVAKPIGRLGGPGLIPVSFIEIRDMTSGQAVPDAHEAVQRAGVPKVEEWKKMAADYKNSSITLGKFEVPSSQQQGLEQGMDRLSLQQQQNSRQSQQSGPGYVSIVIKFLVNIFLTTYRTNNKLDSRSKLDLPNRHNNLSKHCMPRNPPHNYMLLYRRAYPDTVSRRTNIGSRSRQLWKMDDTGNFPDTTKTFMISRSHF
jgi:hypothetical protein